ncbi:MAG: FemAB family PEP-CTERM system-associated protein [Alphaproteobacteria bacterium]|nr:MAG: FemAB family PEP-CTERM system-associated protein [Alphaproteobacteria bacterium]
MSDIVREMLPADAAAWDAFVAGHPDGTFCHRAGWKQVLETGAGQSCPYLLVERDGAIAGILPLSFRKSTLFGRAAISSMFAVYGGPIALDAAAMIALDKQAWALARAWGVDVLEYRTIAARHPNRPGWQVPEPKSATFKRAIEGDDDALLTAIPRKQRAVVRKALANGLVSDWSGDLDTFYKLYAYSVHGLGTPVFPKSLFRAFAETFAGDIDIQVVRDSQGSAVASLMSFYDADTVLPYYAGGSALARGLGAHDFMYFDLMKRARDKGRRYFDFGRSKIGSGPYAFKKNWGFEPTPLQYEYRVAPGARVPDLSPTSGKYKRMVDVWKRLPLWLANIAGPPVARHLG